MKREVEPEWLDELPANHPEALRSRTDLHRLNRLMGNVNAMADLLELTTGEEPFRRMVELGAGDGTFALRLAREIAALCQPGEWVLIDFKDAVTPEAREGLAALGWQVEVVVADVFEWLGKASAPLADVTLANLFLHQFTDKPLAKMLGLASEKTRVFAACEPRRSTLPLALSRLTGLIGCNAVTRNDAPASVRAGFDDRELSVLWPGTARFKWRLREQNRGWFTHTFLAERIAG